MKVNNVLELIGNTPIIKIKSSDSSADIYAKVERNNPSGSVKDRAVLGMYENALKNNNIGKDTVFIEATSGNTGIALAMLGAIKGHRVILTMPDSMSLERRKLLSAYGAELILTPAVEGMSGADNKVKELLQEIDNSVQLSQFENRGNPNMHYKTTAQEIIDDLKNFDVFVAGVGTGGTTSGVAKYLKEQYNNPVKIVAIEPEESAIISTGIKGPHKIQGIGAGYIPKNYWSEYVDEVQTVKQEDALRETRALIKSDGLFVGISAGANVFVAKQIAKEIGKGKVVVTILPDDGMKYISTGVFDSD